MIRSPGLALLVALLLAGGGGACGGGDGDSCDSLADTEWLSTVVMSCGLTRPDDPTGKCYWSVTFNADGTFQSTYEDTGEGGTWTCRDRQVTATGSGGATLTGTLDPAGEALFWDGVQYQRAQPHYP